MPSLKFSNTTYRYGFNGKEKDDINIIGTILAYEFREFDTRLGRFMSTDPKSGQYSWQSPYAYHRNSPTNTIDFMGLGDPPITAYHNTSAESAAKILKDNFKAGSSGWNFFMTNSSGKAAGSDVASAPVQIETSINTEGAKTITNKQWSGFFEEAKSELGFSEIENNQLSKAQRSAVDALRNQKAVGYMNAQGGDVFIIEAKPGASSGQKFIVLTDKAVEARVSIESIPKGQEAVVAQIEKASISTGISRASMGTKMFRYGKLALRFVGEGLLIEGTIIAMKYKEESTKHYVERKSLNGYSPFMNWMLDTYSDVGLYDWYQYSIDLKKK